MAGRGAPLFQERHHLPGVEIGFDNVGWRRQDIGHQIFALDDLGIRRAANPMRAWLDALPQSSGRAAAFETRIWWSPGSAAKAILRKLEALGYRPAARAERFVVQGKYGPLRDGELERAKAWGAELAQIMK